MMFLKKNKYFISIFLLGVFIALIILGIFFFKQHNDANNVVLRIGFDGVGFFTYDVSVTNKGKVKAVVGYGDFASLSTYTPPFVQDVRFSYETTLSESELNEILDFADKACAESSKIKKPFVHFEAGAEEVYIMYKDYKINHYINVGYGGVPILDDFIKMFTEKIDFVYVGQGGLWKVKKQ